MNGQEINKIFGAVTGTLAAFLGLHIIADGVFGFGPGHQGSEKLAYALENSAAPTEAVEENPLPVLLAAADVAAGERAFNKCSGCHEVSKGGEAKVGPPLYGVLGRPIASAEGFKYAGLAAKEGEWTWEALDAFLENPKGWAPQTAMALKTRKPEERAALLVYLNTQSDAPIELPAADAAAVAAAKDAADAAPAPAEDFGVLFIAAGVEETYYACTSCHSERIVAQQGQSRAGWDDMLVWMVEEQGMSEIEEPRRTAILDYLSAHYGPERPNFPK